ncbi:MAG: hypothetical protein GX652_09025 [Burkholderiaceae bacterium]|nr:hypothetical protein [Burkholderiaceae bacterium]
MKSKRCMWAAGFAGMAAALILVAAPAGAAETVKIFRSTMPDGSVVLSDKPAAGARTVASDTIVLAAAAGAADAERDYWRQQAEAFNRRQAMRDAERDRARGQGIPPMAMHHQDDVAYPAYVVGGGHPAKPIVPLRHVPRVYRSSPGAVRGRDGGFIGSGFSTAR